MKIFDKVAAQGEIMIRRVSGRRDLSGSPLAPESGKLIIGHSETGHHHVLEHARGVTVTVLDRAPEGMKILHAILAEPNKLIHKRGHDTHDTIALDLGEYEFRIAREYDPYAELARQAMD
jgi:hypothetical protein